MNVPGLLQQYKSYLQTFEQSCEVQVIPQNQKQEDVFSTCPFYKGKAIISKQKEIFNKGCQSESYILLTILWR